ncbi:Mitogen-activated protein kinase kinase kinase 3-like protein [Drosera capensis]
MPAWWSKKSRKIKSAADEKQQIKSSSTVDHRKPNPPGTDNYKDHGKFRNFDEVVSRRNWLPELNHGYGLPELNHGLIVGSVGNGGSSAFSGFDSLGGGVPLPRPSSGQQQPGSGLDLNSNSAASDRGVYGSVSVSSVSSSVSSEESPHFEMAAAAAQIGFSRDVKFEDDLCDIDTRRHEDVRQNARSRSPGPRSRPATTPTSPLQYRLGGLNLESPTGRHEEGRSQGHPLPLPPGSPTTASPVHPLRASVSAENSSSCKGAKWLKGELLGSGSFGQVFKGFNWKKNELGQKKTLNDVIKENGNCSEGGGMCAIKEIRVDEEDQTARESFKQLNQEINLLSQLQHPNIVRFFGSELGEETLSIYMEYVSGGSIHQLLQQYGPFKEPVIKNYTRQILSGLAYLHSRKTVHRDIKGANILVETNAVIKLADFGMAKHVNSLSSVLSFKGSPYWMAPEVVMNQNGNNLAVDIWSLGCTIIEMATSKPPWSQYPGVGAIFKIGNSKDLPEIPDFLSNEAKGFLKLCLQRDPSARSSAAELLSHPFVSEQATIRVPQLNPLVEGLPHSFDGGRHHQPIHLDINPLRKSISTYEVDLMHRPSQVVSRELRDNSRTITSLPVSPCSSPLRQNGPAWKSCFLTPPHPTFGVATHSSYDPSDILLSPTRANTNNYTFDPWLEATTFRSRTLPMAPQGRDPFEFEGDTRTASTRRNSLQTSLNAHVHIQNIEDQTRTRFSHFVVLLVPLCS